MGAATALYSATCFAQGKYGNGYPYPVNLRAIVGLSGWLPGARCDSTPSHPHPPPQEQRNKVIFCHPNVLLQYLI